MQEGLALSRVGVPVSVAGSNGLLCRQVVHIFTHIHQTYIVYNVCLEKNGDGKEAMSDTTRWITRLALQEAAVSTAVKKVCL